MHIPILILLLLSSCRRLEFTKKRDKGLIELAIATGVMLKAASCQADIEVNSNGVRVSISAGSKEEKEASKEQTGKEKK